MTSPLDHLDIRQEQANTEFAVLRSACIDAFADLELAVAKAALKTGSTVNRDCLGRRIAALGKAKPSPALSKANAALLPAWIVRAEDLAAQRAAIVHARMELGLFGNGYRACFGNVVDVVAHLPVAMVYSLADLHRLKVQVNEVTTELTSLVKGISSPIP